MPWASSLYKEPNSPRLCMAGGVALNCVANGKILRDGPFKELWIQPAAGDAGGALGAAMTVWHQMLGKPRTSNGKDKMQGSLLGPEYSDTEIRRRLDAQQAVDDTVTEDESDE